jgi:predicted membrane-bound spermidine synthase
MKNSLFTLLIIIVCIFIIRMYMSRQSTKIDLSGLEILNHLESPYQTIDLVRDKNTNQVAMFLNGEIQNHTKEYKKSHYAMVDIPIKMLTNDPKNILILGGGDGYPAMRALKQPNVYIKNVEIDDTLINFVKTNPIMRKLSEDSFNDPRLDLTAMDAYKYIYEETKQFDLIVYDLAREVTNNTATEFDRHDDHILGNLLNETGILVYTADLHADAPSLKNVYKQYFKLKDKSFKQHFILHIQSDKDFDVLSKSCPMNIKKLKETHPASEIGILMYNLNCRCGNYGYNEELYFYVSKQPFNKTNQDIEFYPFSNILPRI